MVRDQSLEDAVKMFREMIGGVIGSKKQRRNYTLNGDNVGLEPETYEGKPCIKLYFPNNQVARVPAGTRGTRVRYESPTDGGKRIISVAYLNGRCRIEVPKSETPIER
jgi:hypothetical protein